MRGVKPEPYGIFRQRRKRAIPSRQRALRGGLTTRKSTAGSRLKTTRYLVEARATFDVQAESAAEAVRIVSPSDQNREAPTRCWRS